MTNQFSRLRAAAMVTALATTGLAAPAVAQDTTPEVVVSASRTPVAAEEVGSAVTVITADQIQARNYQYVSDVLREVPGVAVARTGSLGGLTQVFLRGAESNHVLVIVDGIEIAPATSGLFDFSTLLARDIERMEVVRGPQSGVYGSNALAGVINIVTVSGKGPMRITTAYEGGSFGTHQISASARGGFSAGNLAVSFTRREAAGFSAAEIGTEDDGDTNTTAFMKAGVDLTDNVRVDGLIRWVEKLSETDRFDFSGGPNQGLAFDGIIDRSDTQELALKLAGTLNLFDDMWSQTMRISALDTNTRGQSSDFGPFGNDDRRTTLAYETTVFLETPDYADAAHTLTGLIEYERESYTNPFGAPGPVSAKRELYGLAAEYRADLFDRFSLSAALRHDINDDFEDATTYRLTASYRVKETGSRLHTSLGTGSTNPTFFEQFGFTPVLFVGNPNLQPETSTGWDIGIEQTLWDGRLVADLTYFDADLEDEIVSAPAPGRDFLSTSVNAPGTNKRSGVEFSVSARPIDGLSLTGSYTYVESDDAAGVREARRPRHTASADATYRFLEDRASLSAGVVHNGDRLDNDFRGGFTPVLTELDGYTVVNLAGSYRINDRIEIFGRVENAFDEQYQEVLSYATPGVAAYAGVRLTFGPGR